MTDLAGWTDRLETRKNRLSEEKFDKFFEKTLYFERRSSGRVSLNIHQCVS
jgi:hypothetical protein